MNKITLAKTATSWIVGAGVGSIVHAIIRNNTQPDEVEIDGETYTEKVSLSNRVSVPVATVVVTMMAKDRCSAYTDAKIDEFVELWNKTFSKTSADTETESE